MDKAYIVANKKQELDVLKKFEQNGLFWMDGENPTKWLPCENVFSKYNFSFPYVLIDDGGATWCKMNELEDETIVYDGRKEGKMDKKYKVTQEFMDELVAWRDDKDIDAKTGYVDAFVSDGDIALLPVILGSWWTDLDNPIENNNRLITIIQWLNGEDVFEVEEPHKFIVRSDNPDEDGDYLYVEVLKSLTSTSYSPLDATRFNTREEAQEWANSHQVVVEIDEDGNEED